MFNFFVLSFLLSIPAFFLGIINPKWVAAPTRKRSTVMYGGLMAASFVLVGVTAPKPLSQVSVAPEATDRLESSQTAKPSPLSAVPTPPPETVKTLLSCSASKTHIVWYSMIIFRKSLKTSSVLRQRKLCNKH